jgi:ribonuclease HII
MIFPTLDYEKKYWEQGRKAIVGIDEAGRGPLAGPVVAGAVAVFPEIIEEIVKDPVFKLVRDSKTLSFRQREQVYHLVTTSFPFGVGWSSVETIDRINILQAAFLAMKKAVFDLKRKLKVDIDLLLIDGQQPIPNISMRQENIANGDKFVFSIAAASIVAKVTRDQIMMELHEKFPQYGFARHKGYGTKLHFEMIAKHGPCEVHRKSFKLLRNPNAKAQMSNQAQNPKSKKF